MSGRRLRMLTALVALALALGCTAGYDGGGADGGLVRVNSERTAPAGPPAPAAGAQATGFYVDPHSAAARQVRDWELAGRTADAALLRRIADRPMAVWPSHDDPARQITPAVTGAAAAGTTPVLVLYNIPHRDCGLYSRGGAATAAAYRSYVAEFAAAVGDRPAVVVLEPDAVPHVVAGCTAAVHHAERYRLLRDAVARLKAQPGVRVYVDAGNAGWIPDPSRLVEPLRRAGVAQADGFALNVSNFHTDAASVAYGKRLSAALDGARFVVDSSRNGNGPPPDGTWCNPPGRALGRAAAAVADEPLVDAYLWVKRPGESDGECRGGPPAGQWWPSYALDLARNSSA
ncbi:glycoside hydrolase family 6 protein [Streptomyces sp. 549]|uniref:glycoside hydrolase family 6 protein n=1 Tax=Streptomyces sp. 549 TaxID=3049076 RepID=UPI0024C2E2FC|nr:glycoside hydrolase family 6 protein [Streptomyces sp. 549]MDK1474884.1 glycoside hydrolase family 6 protein [Streptomyces sp. 549]